MTKHDVTDGRPIGRRTILRGAAAWAGASMLPGATRAVAKACSASSGSGGKPALMADLAADLPGVNTHINYLGSIYDSGYASIVKPRLLELGVRHIRDNPGGDSDNKTKDRCRELAAGGIRLCLTTANEGDYDLDYVKALGTGVVEAVECPNERDNASNNWGSGWADRMERFALGMYPRYKNDPVTKNLPIIGPSWAKTAPSPGPYWAGFAKAANYLDRANIHSYCGKDPEGSGGGGWGITLTDAVGRQRYGSTKPVWATECGYKQSGSQNGHSAVTSRAAAKYLPRTFLSHLVRGAPRVYVYQLINNNSEDFGLLNSNGSPRLQFTAMKNFIALFRDPGSAFTTGTLSYTLGGSLTGIQQVLFQKRDGRFYLALWQGVLSSKVATSDSGIGDVEPSRRQLLLSLGMKIRAAKVYEPSFSSSPTQTYANSAGIASIPLLVPDHVQVIELVPAGCA
jgi:hypothetical protein